MDFVNFAYIIASVLFIFGIKMLGSASTARRGNQISALGMLIALVVTLFDRNVLGYGWIAVGLAIGAGIGFFLAKKVEMTGMPELVALFNGLGGLASVFVGWAEFDRIKKLGWEEYLDGGPAGPTFILIAIFFAVLIGGITFTGSIVAYLKLSGKMGGSPTQFAGQKLVNAGLLAVALILGIVFVVTSQSLLGGVFVAAILVCLLLGVMGVLPIGGGDMPVVIALLNSLSGLAASAAGFVILNNVLIVAGCLVGASGVILTFIMCKAMNRTLGNVLFGGFGAAAGGSQQAVEGEMKAVSAQDAFYVLEAAQSVVFIPGYGMAVAQAQHAVKELAAILEDNGADVKFAIHPVAGRMPGHMNVLLAEADVPYEQLAEMDDVNPILGSTDVAFIIGANDVVNPAACDDETSPIYGMPIINAHEAKTVYCLKRGQGAGFSGLVNTLFFRPNTRMIYGDAKETITSLVAEFKD